jgi:uncharacterized protein (DUF1501 family)
MNRRAFLQTLSWAGAVSLAAPHSAWALISPSGAVSTMRRLIVVFMRGAVEGLSLVVPFNEAITIVFAQQSRSGSPGAPAEPSISTVILVCILHWRL